MCTQCPPGFTTAVESVSGPGDCGVIFLINGTLSLMVTGMRNPLLAVAEPDGVRLWLVQGAHVQ